MSQDGGVDAFPHSWSAQVLPKAPLIAPVRQFIYPQHVPGEEDALNRGALLISVKPTTGGNFMATCALGFRDPSLPSGIWSSPDPDHMVAVAGGYAYHIDTRRPDRSLLLEQRPVTALLALPEYGCLLLAGFHDVLALGAEGVRWRTGRLSWEGITLGSVEGGFLHGVGWEMFSDKDVPFTIDLQTGSHQGGGYGAFGGSAKSTE